MLGSDVATGIICAFEEKLNLFQRVRVEILCNHDQYGVPHTAFVRSLDECWTKVVKVYTLFLIDIWKFKKKIVYLYLFCLCRLISCIIYLNILPSEQLRQLTFIFVDCNQEIQIHNGVLL